MIVNTAYIYMGVGGGGGGTPANPNLWQDGVAHYPVVFTNSSITADGLNFVTRPGDATFSELPLTYFNRLTLSGRMTNSGASKAKIKIEFYSGDNVLIETPTTEFLRSEKSVAVDIPSSAKIQNAKIKIKKTETLPTVTLSSAVLS